VAADAIDIAAAIADELLCVRGVGTTTCPRTDATALTNARLSAVVT